MKSNRFFTPTTVAAVTLVHLGIIAATWHAVKPPKPPADNTLTVVELGALPADSPPSVERKPAANPVPHQSEIPPAPPQKQPEKPVSPQKQKTAPPAQSVPPTLKAVERSDRPADMAADKPQLKTPVQKQPEKPVLSEKTPLQKLPEKSVSTENTPTSRQPEKSVSAEKNAKPSAGNSGSPSDMRVHDAGSKNTDKPQSPKLADPNKIVDGDWVGSPPVSYPPQAEERGIEGVVHIEFLVEPNGSVSSPKIIKSSGKDILDNAALANIRRAHFKPKTVNGTAVRTRYRTKYTFRLD